MVQFQAHELAYIYAYFNHIEQVSAKSAPQEVLTEADQTLAAHVIEDVIEKCILLGLPTTQSHAERARRKLDSGCTNSEMKTEAYEVRKQLHNELKRHRYLSIPEKDASLYEKSDPFGQDVSNALPDAATDIHESSRCIALDRPTAAVFHLMRAVEHGLQKFAAKLGVLMPSEMVWQEILNALNRPIAALPQQAQSDKDYKTACAEVAAHLFYVKLAWRNPTMHPKSLYSPEEAREIFERSGSFLRELVKII